MPKLRLIYGFLGLLFMVAPAVVSAQEADEATERRREIRRLMEVSGEVEGARQTMIGLIENLRKGMNLPDEFWEKFKDAAMSDELFELFVPIYERHFTREEIRELTRFFESPIGQVLVRKQRLVQQEAMSVGERWGAQTAEEIMRGIQEKNKKENAEPEGPRSLQ